MYCIWQLSKKYRPWNEGCIHRSYRSSGTIYCYGSQTDHILGLECQETDPYASCILCVLSFDGQGQNLSQMSLHFYCLKMDSPFIGHKMLTLLFTDLVNNLFTFQALQRNAKGRSLFLDHFNYKRLAWWGWRVFPKLLKHEQAIWNLDPSSWAFQLSTCSKTWLTLLLPKWWIRLP